MNNNLIGNWGVGLILLFYHKVCLLSEENVNINESFFSNKFKVTYIPELLNKFSHLTSPKTKVYIFTLT